MEEKRIFLAFFLSMLIILAYQYFIVKPATKTQAPQPTGQVTATEEKVSKPVKETEPPVPPSKKEEKSIQVNPQELQREEKTLVVEDEYVKAVFSSRGGVLKSWSLKKYKINGTPLDLVKQQEGALLPFSVYTGDEKFDRWANSEVYSFKKEKNKILFYLEDQQGNKIIKNFEYVPPYQLKIKIRIFKDGKELSQALWGPSIAPFSRDGKNAAVLPQVTYLLNHKPKTTHEKKLLKKVKEQGKVEFYGFDWINYENRYFMALFFPGEKKASFILIKEMPYLLITQPERAFLGPKDYELLKRLGGEMHRSVRLGLFSFIGIPLLKVMKWFYKNIIPNYGLAIIFVTIIIKLLFYPLTHKSSVSMYKMQKLQPKIKLIQQKYKGADPELKKKMNAELMELYKKEGVNPASGCLPILIQIPILWAFFSLLTAAIELWQQPFILWIKDLSAKDPYYILPILMGITQFLLQIMTPTTNPAQQKTTAVLMSGFFTFLFAGFPSGLVLYWLTNNVLSIAQQHIINKYLKALEGTDETTSKRVQRKKP